MLKLKSVIDAELSSHEHGNVEQLTIDLFAILNEQYGKGCLRRILTIGSSLERAFYSIIAIIRKYIFAG